MRAQRGLYFFVCIRCGTRSPGLRGPRGSCSGSTSSRSRSMRFSARSASASALVRAVPCPDSRRSNSSRDSSASSTSAPGEIPRLRRAIDMSSPSLRKAEWASEDDGASCNPILTVLLTVLMYVVRYLAPFGLRMVGSVEDDLLVLPVALAGTVPFPTSARSRGLCASTLAKMFAQALRPVQ
jgi:hypothetical protein